MLWQVFVILLLVTCILLCIFLIPMEQCPTPLVPTKLKLKGLFQPRATLPFPNAPIVISLANTTSFGKFMFVHDQGFVCVTATSGGLNIPRLLFYQIQNSSIVKLPTEIQIPEFLLDGSIANICAGCFMSSLGVFNEIYYLILTLGTTDLDNNLYGRELHIYCYDTSVTNPVWFKSSEILQHPFFGTNENPRPSGIPPWVGCFGNSLQSVIVQNITGGSIQSLYIAGTQFLAQSQTKPQPSSGGMIFQYLLLSNTVNPVFRLQFTIQDAKLLALSEDSNSPNPPVFEDEFDYYMHSFGSVFFANSEFLAVSNLTNQDTLSVPCGSYGNSNAANGYVQVFRFVAGLWTQQYNLCDGISFGKQIYVNRIVGPSNAIGFGNGLNIVSNYLFVNTANNLTFVYNIATDSKASPIDMMPWSQVPTSELSSLTTYPGSVYNRNLLFSGQYLVLCSYNVIANLNLIGIYATSGGSSISPTQDTLFKNFQLLQLIGNGTNSGSVGTSLFGFAQNVGITRSQNRLRNFLLVNDPQAQRILAFEN